MTNDARITLMVITMTANGSKLSVNGTPMALANERSEGSA